MNSLFHGLLSTSTFTVQYNNVIKYASSQEFGLPSYYWNNKVDAFVEGTISDGIWDLIDYGVIFVGDGSPNFKSINIKSPGSNQGTIISSPFIDSNGITGDAIASYFNSNFNPFVHSIYASQNSNSYAIGIYTDSEAGNKAEFGYEEVGNYIGLFSKLEGDVSNSRNNSTSSDSVSHSNSNRIGRYIGYRESSSIIRLSKNGVVVGSDTTAPSVAFANGNFYICGRNDIANNNILEFPSPDTIQYFFWGNFGSLHTLFDSRLNTLLS